MLDMDDETFRKYFRLTRQQYEVLNDKLTETGGELNSELGCPARIPQNIKTPIFLWYMANQNSLRELGEKCQVAQSTAHDVVMVVTSGYSGQRGMATATDNVIGAIDGCHIRLQRPKKNASDYINRKCYYSKLLQGICGFFFVLIVTIDYSMYLCVHDI